MADRICKALSGILGDGLSEDLGNYIWSIDDLADYEDYMKNLLDISIPEQRDVYEKIKDAKFGKGTKKNDTPKISPFVALSDLLGGGLAEDLEKYVSTVENRYDFEEYMRSLLDLSNKDQRKLYEQIVSKKFSSKKANVASTSQISAEELNQRDIVKSADQLNKLTISNKSNKFREKMVSENVFSKKENLPSTSQIGVDEFNQRETLNSTIGNKSNKKRKPQKNIVQKDTSPKEEIISPQSSHKPKKYTKYLLSELHQGYLKEGRQPCECQAVKHNLINNCLECGRIVCEQEGSGPCFFCNNMVCTREEMEILNSNTKQANSLYRTLNERKKSEAWKKAIHARDRLLDYDKHSVQRTKVIDDEHDYFEINNQWLNKQQREKVAKKAAKEEEEKHGSRLNARKYTLDILGRNIVETGFDHGQEESEEEHEEEHEKEHEEKHSIGHAVVPDIDSVLKSIHDEKIQTPNQYVPKGDKKDDNNGDKKSDKKFGKKGETKTVGSNHWIIQDKTFLEMRDMGMCLSMHQPWATLLLLGVKKHEGRTWYTPHRGPLWIAAGAKQPDPEVIKDVEIFYKEHYNDRGLKIPKKYPTGCLLGNVLVQDCLSQEEYRLEYPNGESESPFVLICSDPQVLPFAFPMQGEHKIYKLNSLIHKMAREALIVRRKI